MTRYFIEAADVLFFKDGREIAPGSEYTAASIFPPNPGTVYGALRSSLLALQENSDFSKDDFGISGTDTAKYAGQKNSKGDLVIKNFLLARRDENKISPLFRLPLDVLNRKKPDYSRGEKDEIHMISIRTGSSVGIKSNMPLAHLQMPWIVHEEGSFFEHTPSFINEKHFYDYLKGEIGTSDDENSLASELLGDNDSSTEPFVKEPRIGIGISSETQTVEEGKLFTTPFIRLQKDIGFWIELNLEDKQLPDRTKLRLGGDGKIAMLNAISENPETDFDLELKKKVQQASILKLVLTTPVVFKNGWIPDGIDLKTGEGKINDVTVKLLGSAIGKYQNMGGWNVAHNHPKATHRAVPAGSVYYVSVKEPSEAFEKIHKNSICMDLDNRKQGLGITYLGVNK